MKKSIAIAITVIFIISTINTFVIGYKSDVVEDIYKDELLRNLLFLCHGEKDGSAKYEHYYGQLLRDYSYNINIVEENVVQLVEQAPTTRSGNPMDSPWPMKCHDTRHTSRSPYSTINTTGIEKWRFKTSWQIEGGAVIDNDRTIYFGCFDKYLYALYQNSTLKWKYKTGGWIWSTPAIDKDGTIYVTSYDGFLHAVYLNNGTRKWKINVGTISSSPAIAEDGTIYFGTMGNKIYAINPNGTEKWHYKTGYKIVSDPAIGDDGTIYIGSGDTYFYAMNPNGTLKWRFKTGDIIKSHPSIANDGTIYFDSFDGILYALYPNNGTMKWKCNGGSGCSSACIDENGTIYYGFYNLNAVYPNGTLKWSFNLGTNRHIGHSSPAISADGTIYIGTNIGDTSGGEIIAIKYDGTERWRKKIANDWVDSSPAIAEDGAVYIGSTSNDAGYTYGYLHAFGIGELEAKANGPYYGLVDLSMQFNGSASGGYPSYNWYWNFGDGNISSEQNPTHIYSNLGNYTVKLTVIDNKSNTTDDTTWAWIQESNDPPNKPSIIGETKGKTGTKYEYNFSTNDIEKANICYYIDWGDDTNTGWLGPYSSGKKINKSHSWFKKDTYTIRCRAKDPYGAESEWGELKVTMPKNQQITNNLFLRFFKDHPRTFSILRHFLGLK